MLRSLDPSRSRPYRAPWTVDRRDDRHTLVRNVRGQSSRVMLAWYRWRTGDEYCCAFVP